MQGPAGSLLRAQADKELYKRNTENGPENLTLRKL